MEETADKKPSLAYRLRQKLRELNQAHQECVSEQAAVDQKIRDITEQITSLPRKQAQLQHEIEALLALNVELQATIDTLDQKMSELKAHEQEQIVTHRAIRQEILSNVCQADETDIVEDGLDVKTAEIRRFILAGADQLSALSNKKAEIAGKIEELREMSTVERIAASRDQLQADLDLQLEEQKQVTQRRNVARVTLEECQRILEDLEERYTLEMYAKKNGLVLEGNSTDELIRVCRTHQEKIAAKNAAVDNVRPTPLHHDESSSDDDDHFSTTSGDCSCSECVRSVSSVDSVRYFRVQEALRRQDGLTVAGAINNKMRRQTRQEHGENGWCQHW